jgi:hypothetical protein
MALVRILLTVSAFLVFVPTSAFAQEGCKTVQFSCTQMQQRCEKSCEAARDKTICAAQLCAPPLARCKASGTWQSVGSKAACWKTNNRS